MPRTTGRLALDDQLCFALYAASRAMTARYRPHLDAIGLTYPQYLVMVVVWDQGATTVGMLGERLRLDSGTLSPLLKRLEASGLITRARRPDDERSVEIRPTAKGRRLHQRAARIPSEIRASLAGLDHDRLMTELHSLEAHLRTM
ncbi:MAG: MarR family winged helix-turn-helix transcriptional regulator [Jatrophihabitantaceae bacterium]